MITKKTWRYKVRRIRVCGDIAYIPLTQGKVATIDAADVPLVEGWNWSAMPARCGLWYAYCSGNRKIRLHQLLMPPPPGMMTDHSDRDGLNCRRSNLRHATALQNSHNKKRVGKSRFKGVSKHQNLWRARITVDGVRQILGSFETAKAAAEAYDAAAKMYFRELAYLNFPAFGNEVDKFSGEVRP
jgi:hypothetical protein